MTSEANTLSPRLKGDVATHISVVPSSATTSDCSRPTHQRRDAQSLPRCASSRNEPSRETPNALPSSGTSLRRSLASPLSVGVVFHCGHVGHLHRSRGGGLLGRRRRTRAWIAIRPTRAAHLGLLGLARPPRPTVLPTGVHRLSYADEVRSHRW